MGTQTRILFYVAVVILTSAMTAAAQTSYQDLKKLELNSSEAMIPIPSGGALQGKGLDSWMNGLGPGGEAGVVRGFSSTTRTDDQKFFTLGSLYSGLIVQTGSPSMYEAAKGIADFREAPSQLRAPAGFFGYLSVLELMTKSRAATPAIAARMAAAIQGFVSDFAHSHGDVAYLNYQAGQWVTTLALAARAHDAGALNLPAANYFQEKFAAQHANAATLAVLKSLQDFAGKEKLGDADYVQIEKLAEQLRDQLG